MHGGRLTRATEFGHRLIERGPITASLDHCRARCRWDYLPVVHLLGCAPVVETAASIVVSNL